MYRAMCIFLTAKQAGLSLNGGGGVHVGTTCIVAL